MPKMLMDTDTMSFFLRGDVAVKQAVSRHLYQHGKLYISIINQYEILSGLYFKNAQRQLQIFELFLPKITVLPLTNEAVEIASQQYAKNRKNGVVVDDIDLLIGSIALANNMGVATHNTKHYNKINGLYLEDWCLSY